MPTLGFQLYKTMPHRPIRPVAGSVLVIVAGITALIALTFLMVLSLTRDDAGRASQALRMAQHRIVLTSALLYLQETSRLGWGEETMGWIDPRFDPSVTRPDGSAYRNLDLVDGPRRMKSVSNVYPPVFTAGTWPAPGSTMRADLAPCRRAPFAVSQRMACPVINQIGQRADGVSIFDPTKPTGYADWVMRPLMNAETIPLGVLINQSSRVGITYTYLPVVPSWIPYGDAVFKTNPGGIGISPIATDQASYVAGDTNLMPEYMGLAWFRIYREVSSQHDGLIANTLDKYADGTTPYDIAPEVGNGTFVITCGAGGSRGFKDYSEANAALPGWFADAQTFGQIRQSEIVSWYRVQWSPQIGGNFNKEQMRDNFDLQWTHPFGIYNHNVLTDRGTVVVQDPGSDIHTTRIDTAGVKAPFGSFSWVQKLEKEPPQW